MLGVRSVGNLSPSTQLHCEPNIALKSEVCNQKILAVFSEIKMDLVNFVLRLCVAVFEITRYFEVFQTQG